MGFLWDGIRQGFSLIFHGDPYTWHLIWVTLRVALESTAIALVLGLPLGLWLGIGSRRPRARRRERAPRFLALAIGNAGLGLPPVFVGLLLSLLMFPAAPLGRFHLLFTLEGVIIAQTVLGVPIVTALTASAVRSLAPGLLDQARALGAHTGHVWLLALREARIGVIAAMIAAIGSALSEVGAVVLVGGNIEGSTQTLASAALEQVNAGHFGEGMAIGVVLLGLILIVAAALTAVQLRAGGDARGGLRRTAT
jgi:tungstate transport system permease protein